MNTTTSTDGTTIAFDRVGHGHPLVIVGGAFSYRSFPLQQELAHRLSDSFDVISYDRRGRGDSGDVQPYSVAAEVDDLAAVIKAVGDSAFVWGISSGGALALEAAASGLPIDKLAVYDPPFVVTRDHGVPPQDLLERVQSALDAGDPDRAVRVFMTDGMGAPGFAVGLMRLAPVWKRLRAVAHTIPYDIQVMQPNISGRPLAATHWSEITAPVLVNAGTKNGKSRQVAAAAVAAALPHALLRLLVGEGIAFKPVVVEQQLRAFLTEESA